MEKTSVNPVFIRMKDIPEADVNRPSVLEMCLAAESVSGQGSVIGSQNIRSLWRIYPATREARQELLIKGMRLRNSIIQVSNTNPFLLKDDNGEDKPTTKVWIDNIPISVADSEIEHSLSKIGCELRSDIKSERARDSDGKLTRFLTGRRFVFISVPATPLDKFLKISIFSARIYHREQKQITQTVKCSKCLQVGHHVSTCDKDIVCRVCHVSGHKRGDPQCQLFTQKERDSSSGPADRTGQCNDTLTDDKTGRPTDCVTDEVGGKTDSRHRGRQNVRQTTLRPSLALEHPRRHRSETPKRRRSGDVSPRGSQGLEKQPRREDPSAGSGSQRVAEQSQDAGKWG